MYKGDARVVTRAFVRPGRTHDFVCHARCATVAMISSMVDVYGSVDRVPVAAGVKSEAASDIRAQLAHASLPRAHL